MNWGCRFGRQLGNFRSQGGFPLNKKFIVRLSEQERSICQEVIKKLKGSSQKVRPRDTQLISPVRVSLSILAFRREGRCLLGPEALSHFRYPGGSTVGQRKSF